MFKSLSLLAIATLVASTSGAAIQKRSPASTPANTCSPKTPGQNVGNPSVPGSFVKITDVAVEGPAGGNGFTILAATGIAVVPSTTIHGNIGVAPVPLSYITGFSLTDHVSWAESVYVTYPQTVGGVVGQGKVYGADSQASKSPITVVYMGGVYTEANGMVTDFAECHSGVLDNLVMKKGVYEWSTSVSLSFNSVVTLSGSSTDVFIMKSAGAFSFGAQSKVLLDGVNPDNVFWVAATSLTVGDTAQFQGVALTYTNIVIADNAIVKGRLLSQTEVALAKGTQIFLPSDNYVIA